jgi:Tol biopolymer transport system component
MRPARTTFTAAALALSTGLLLPGTATAAAPSAPSGQGIVVWTHRTADGEHLMVARADGSHARSLTPVVPGGSDIDAQVSPDGRWVAYEHDDAQSATIRMVRPDGSGDHAVDVGCVDPCAAAVAPTWLSDDRIAFTLVVGPFGPDGAAASVAAWTSRPDGSHRRRLSPAAIDGRFEDSYVRASADRSYLTFVRFSDALGAGALFRSDPDGRHARQLTPFALNAEVNDLSTARRGPTKDLLVFESFGRGDPAATFVDLATVPTTCASLADCTPRIHWLTDNAATGRRNANPQWSPDGSSIVFTDRAGIDVVDAEIWTMRYLGTQRRKISDSPDFDFRPAWGARRG